SVRPQRELPDMTAFAVIDEDESFIGRQAEPVRCDEVIGQQPQRPRAGLQRIDASKAEFLRTWNAPEGPAAIGRIGEVDDTVARYHYIIGAVELPAVIPVGEHADTAVMFGAGEAAHCMLAGEQPPLSVESQAVRHM